MGYIKRFYDHPKTKPKPRKSTKTIKNSDVDNFAIKAIKLSGARLIL